MTTGSLGLCWSGVHLRIHEDVEPLDCLMFWQATPIPMFEEFNKSLPLPPGVILGPGDSNSAVAWNSDWKVLDPQPASRAQKVLWIARVLLIPPTLGYITIFFVSPWIMRGFMPGTHS
jgi:hypothetical protein